ncbi:uncharacterized protein LOC121879398 [Homarus americanus]|uniref:Putative Lytic polysaccharide mono-oxygenase, cellulose-degrading-containing protein 10 n=1 Tax=Homarus americanus TaxID=6706 RepID=A0A8J5N9L2_HOMAM|nr:uncharacterized protein LOC121879398 [Homarus americanus]KAG7176125.1 putative Lytic polysaccharide mono-oxygenase, cellulose-degrading-containing protein 10 [Homarus americanus]
MNPGLLLFVLAVGTASAQQLTSPPSRECRELGAMSGGAKEGNSVPTYSAGETITVKAEVPNMKSGAFEFNLCPSADAQDEDCLFKYPLEMADGSGRQFEINSEIPGGQYDVSLILPKGLTCDICTIMWTLITKDCVEGSSCSNQLAKLCADISITEEKTRKTRFWGKAFRIADKALDVAHAFSRG